MPTLGSKLPEIDKSLSAAQEEASRLENDDVRKAWALALAQTVAAAVPPPRSLECGDSSAEAWRTGDATLTGDSSKTATADDVGPSKTTEFLSGSSQSETQDRLITEVDAGRLGRLCVSVNRGESGLSIEILADNPYSHSLLELEKSALLMSLRSGGLQVTSVSVASTPKAGTPFAQVKAESNARLSASKVRAYQSRRKDDGEADRDDGLDLIG